MNHRHLFAAVAAGCFSLALSTTLGAEPSKTGTPTVVLMDSALDELHYLPLSSYRAQVSVPSTYPPPVTHADVLGGALTATLANSIGNELAAAIAQRRADRAIENLTGPLGDDGWKVLLRNAFDDALAAHGMDQQTLMFSGQAVPSPKMFPRMPTARKAENFVLVRKGALGKGWVDLPVVMHSSLRQFRVALEIEILEGDYQRQRRVAKRDVAVYTDVMDFAEGEDPLAVLAANDQARLREELDRAVATVIALVLADHDLPKVGKGDEVGALNRIGLTEFHGVPVEEKDGRALIWTRGDTLVSIPAEQILTGEALVAARGVEALRRTPPVAEDENGDGTPETAAVAAGDPATTVQAQKGAPETGADTDTDTDAAAGAGTLGTDGQN